MIRAILAWRTRSVVGYIVFSLMTVSLPLFALGMWSNIRAGYPTADLGTLIVISLAGGLVPGLLIWLFIMAYSQLKQQRSTPTADTAHPTLAVEGTDRELSRDGQIRYHWRYDDGYYSTVMKRYYAQLPRIRRPLTQYILLWLVGVVVVALSERPSAASLVVGALIVGAIAIPVAAVLTNMGIKTRYLMRPSFGTDADLVLSAAGVTISQMSLNGTYPWTTYTRAVRFDDGVMLLKRGAIRWLPDSALVSGTVEDALQLLRAHLPITSFENQVLRQ